MNDKRQTLPHDNSVKYIKPIVDDLTYIYMRSIGVPCTHFLSSYTGLGDEEDISIKSYTLTKSIQASSGETPRLRTRRSPRVASGHFMSSHTVSPPYSTEYIST